MKELVYKYDYAVVVPVFENNGVIVELARLVHETFEKLKKTYQLILIDDSKTNTSWNYIQQVHESQPDIVTAIRLTRNYGQHNATLCGFEFVEAAWVITMDDDLEIFPDQIPLLIQRQKETEADVVSGRFNRNKGGTFFNFFNKIFVNSGEKLQKEKSTKSSFRLISKTITDKLIGFPHNFIFIDRVLMWYTQAIESVEVAHFPSKKQLSGYQKQGLIQVLGNILFFFSSVPLKAMTYLSLIISFFTLIFGLQRFFKKIFYGSPMGYTSIIVAILFSTSIILFALGIIGEYLRRIYVILNKQPNFEIKEVLKQ